MCYQIWECRNEHTGCAHSARLWLASLLCCGKLAHFSFAVRMSTIAEHGSRMRYYDSDSYSLMQMRHLLPFQIKARPQGGIESKHLSAPAMRQIAVVCHARKHRTGTAQPTLVSTSAECSLSPAEQPANECTMPPVCAHRALLRVRLLCIFGMLQRTFIDRQLGRYALADMYWIVGDLAVPTRLSDAR